MNLLAEETDANNQLIDDGIPVQPLTAAEIEELKQAGYSASVRYIREITSSSCLMHHRILFNGR